MCKLSIKENDERTYTNRIRGKFDKETNTAYIYENDIEILKVMFAETPLNEGFDYKMFKDIFNTIGITII